MQKVLTPDPGRNSDVEGLRMWIHAVPHDLFELFITFEIFKALLKGIFMRFVGSPACEMS